MESHLVHLMQENLVIVIDILLNLHMGSNLGLMKKLQWVLQMDPLMVLMIEKLRDHYREYCWDCMFGVP